MDPFSSAPYQDTRSNKEKRQSWGGALLLGAGVAGAILAKKKIAITRGISRDILAAGLNEDSRYSRYVISQAKKTESLKSKSYREQISDRVSSVKKAALDPTGFVDESIQRLKNKYPISIPIPTDEEAHNIQLRIINKNLGTPLSNLPSWRDLGLRESSLFHRIWRGPRTIAFSPGTSLGEMENGIPNVIGKHGALLIDNRLHILHDPTDFYKTGKFSHTLKGKYSVGLVNSWGANLERVRRGLIEPLNPKNTEEYIRDIALDEAAVLHTEKGQFLKHHYMSRFYPGVGVGHKSTTQEVLDLAEKTWQEGERWTNPLTGESRNIPSPKQFMGQLVSDYDGTATKDLTFSQKLQQDAEKTRALIAKNASNSKYARAQFEAFKFGRKLGISEEFASYGLGFPQQGERWLKKGGEWNYRHPISGEMVRATPRRYNVIGKPLGAKWNGSESSWYITTPKDTVLRNINVYGAGTLHRVSEHAFGIGISSRPNIATEFVRKIAGAKEGSWGDIFIRNMGKTARVIGVGLGAYYTYKAVDSLARSTTGWGPTDIAAGAYVKYREFQQHVLDDLGIVHMSQNLENAFPGSMSSPASHAARLLAPIVMANFFGKRYGPRGFAAGLAAGLAFALVTWGDITQSPQELHKIFTGEEDIPVRKGRYWIMGQTPFFGGKIDYWRPHWYPLMQSKYQYQGQKWSSEKEYWAEGTPFSPLIAPLLGYKYDPYYWEKKHYYDRPYPITGELFEPTAPFAALGNSTIGGILKPARLMHRDYLGTPQMSSSDNERGIPVGTGVKLGFPAYPDSSIVGGDSPYSVKYQTGEAGYSQAEQMGLLGYGVNTLWQKLTGQTNFMSSQSVLQSSRRATGYENEYWQMAFGDPGAGPEEGATEYFRRFLPHRRNNVEEYNPIPNEMPDWLPGSDYFTNFHQGDPYIKIPFGEARLPGAGYESLHQLHSGESGNYDAIDRFLILANVAPYSDEYKEYKRVAIKESKGDAYWADKVQKAIRQRDQLSEEYQFLDTSTENVSGAMKKFSAIYKNSLAGIEEVPSYAGINPLKIATGWIPTHINKWISNKTPEAAYEDFRLYGSEYMPWDQPVQSFVTPVVDQTRRYIDKNLVPVSVRHQRDVQEYFDKLQYIKYTNLAALARFQGDSELASKLSRVARYTMANGNYNPAVAMASIPKEERGFYKAFSDISDEKRREHILAIVPSYMRPYYMEAWNKNDGKDTYNIDYHQAENLTAYFTDHYLPSPSWEGWDPDINLSQVKLRVVKNEAMDIHKFNLWESNERQLARQPWTPLVEDINAPSNDLSMLQNTMVINMEKLGMTNSRVSITRTPSSENTHKIRIGINRDRSDDDNNAMNSTLASISG